jgi:alkaline phosphatase D
LTERDAIMDVLEHVPNVIVLSGDRHEFAAASIRTRASARDLHLRR